MSTSKTKPNPSAEKHIPVPSGQLEFFPGEDAEEKAVDLNPPVTELHQEETVVMAESPESEPAPLSLDLDGSAPKEIQGMSADNDLDTGQPVTSEELIRSIGESAAGFYVPFDVGLMALSEIPKLGRKGIATLLRVADHDLQRLFSASQEEIEPLRIPFSESWKGPINDVFNILLDENLVRSLLERGRELVAGLDEKGVSILGPDDMPVRLAELPSPPPWLFVEGNPDVLHTGPWVAVVGTRTPSPQGMKAAGHVATMMASYSEIILVSGLADGIDAEAHRASMDEGLKNVAFLGHGIDVVFPAGTAGLRKRIVQRGGAVATEYLPGEHYQKSNFVQRNRLQSGLADLVIPVEANATSGTAHTIRFARQFKRPIIGLSWSGANGILKDLSESGDTIIDLTTPEGFKTLDRTFRSLAEKHDELTGDKPDSFAFARLMGFVRKQYRAELARRDIRESDFTRLKEELCRLSEEINSANK